MTSSRAEAGRGLPLSTHHRDDDVPSCRWGSAGADMPHRSVARLLADTVSQPGGASVLACAARDRVVAAVQREQARRHAPPLWRRCRSDPPGAGLGSQRAPSALQRRLGRERQSTTPLLRRLACAIARRRNGAAGGDGGVAARQPQTEQTYSMNRSPAGLGVDPFHASKWIRWRPAPKPPVRRQAACGHDE